MAKKFVCTGYEPVVETKYGKLRGFQLNEVYHFYGIKYADAGRFRMPEEIQPWQGIKDALGYGYAAPMIEPESPEGEILGPYLYWPKSEDCQYLNLWTPAIQPDAKKPVIVWLHGGGYFGGSSVEMVAYDGANLSEYGDMVVVSLNHRLNLLGYFDLSRYHEKYWNSGNLGQADIIAALQWIHDNIAFFGGDPDNVTLFGQSGGGGKINALLQTPAADGLFHKGIIQSGLWRDENFPHSESEVTEMLVEGMLSRLGLDEVTELEKVPYEALAKAYKAVACELNEQGYETGFAPVKNDWYLGNPLEVGFRREALDRPILAGTTFAEFLSIPGIKDKNMLSPEERYGLVKAKYGEYTDCILDLFQNAYPGKNIVDALAVDTFLRSPAIEWLDAKAGAGGADNYAYVFAPDFTLDGGKPAWHCAEIPYAFHNTDRVPVTNVPGVSDLLEKQVAGAWTSFAHSGNPNHTNLISWEPYSMGREVTMVFSGKSEARVNYDRDLVHLINKVAPLHMPGAVAKKK